MLKEAIRLRPEYLKAHYAICKIYSEMGDFDNAKKELEIVKKLDSSVVGELTSGIKLV